MKRHSACYQDSHEHINAELNKLDLLIQRRVIELQLKLQAWPKSPTGFPLFISHEEVDWLLGERKISHDGHELTNLDAKLRHLMSEIKERATETLASGKQLSLARLAMFFQLSDFEIQALIICLAPELDRKYDKLYAYLQDDVTRKRPSVDLVLDLLCESEKDKWQARNILAENGKLLATGLLECVDDPQSPSGSSCLARFLRVPPRVVAFLLDHDTLDDQIKDFVELENTTGTIDELNIERNIKENVMRVFEQYLSGHSFGKMLFHLHGPYGSGKRDLALAMCGHISKPLLCLDLQLFFSYAGGKSDLLALVFREAVLRDAGLFVQNIDAVLTEENKPFLKRLARFIEQYAMLTFFAGNKPWPYKKGPGDIPFYSIALSEPDLRVRKKAWFDVFRSISPKSAAEWGDILADRFKLTPGQIRDAASSAKQECALRGTAPTLPDYLKACRAQSSDKLAESAKKIEPRCTWEDIVLPDGKVAQLKELCNQVKHRYRVFAEWGYDQKISHGKGLSALFSGPPGTGKTMAAEVVAHELGIELYKIDLSGVVSKYIGETEKNLSKIFAEAENTNAVLFFDEADALFGKRTEVSDAHDRYANIETSYLLQKMEEYEGVVILATNLRENMDEAFTRRIRFVVEFPFPDEVGRQFIWEKHFPASAPVANDMDFAFLSKRIPVAGGNIKNIVLNAAFLAANNGNVISMQHVLHATKREYEKMGKLWDESHFKQPQVS